MFWYWAEILKRKGNFPTFSSQNQVVKSRCLGFNFPPRCFAGCVTQILGFGVLWLLQETHFCFWEMLHVEERVCKRPLGKWKHEVPVHRDPERQKHQPSVWERSRGPVQAGRLHTQTLPRKWKSARAFYRNDCFLYHELTSMCRLQHFLVVKIR